MGSAGQSAGLDDPIYTILNTCNEKYRIAASQTFRDIAESWSLLRVKMGARKAIAEKDVAHL